MACETGETVRLGRTVTSAQHASAQSPSRYDLIASMRTEERIVVARDRLTFDIHGTVNTHVDAANHFGADGTWFGGAPAILGEMHPSIADLADGIVTRAIFLDVPAVRGTQWIAPTDAVTASDLDTALANSGVAIERGDAVLLYMGRDAYELAGHSCDVPYSSLISHPGVGESGARWIADREISALLWDFLEASGPGRSRYVVHLLIWAMGLVVVDNCDLGGVRAALAGRKRKSGLIAFAPLDVPTATGCLVNPILVA
jgi:kynurenine formamidase